ncbi:MAG: DegQ family serine endoprotease [Neisseria sp.]|nr:DegQ family serine endoprotease [Neisseria sp.]
MRYQLLPLVLFSALLAVGGCDRFGSNPTNDDSADKAFIKEVEVPDKEGVRMLLPDFTELVEKVGPAVVNIQAQRDERVQNNRFGTNSEIDPFFDFFRQIAPNEPQVQEDAVSYGSGFILSADGYVLTNAHVVKGATSIKVSLTDKREFVARLIGLDQSSDTALLKIDADNLPSVKIGDPNRLKVGEWVAAIGAPFGFDNTMTAGIVSAKKRSLPGENYIPFIQTDVAINPGNSGGPLFNLDGQVVGVNSQIYSRSGGFMGISFAVPIDVAMNVADQLKTTGTVKRGQLGVIIQEVSYDLAKAFGLERAHGALVVNVLPDGPASKTDLRTGDIILAVNGTPVESSSDLPLIIGYAAPHSTVKLSVWRDGQTVETEVVLSELNTAQPTKRTPYRALRIDGETFSLPELGLTLSPLSEQSAQQHNITGGLMVMQADKAAKTLGLTHGDIIVAVGHTQVNNETSLRQALSRHRDFAPLFVLRNGQTLYLPLPLK